MKLEGTLYCEGPDCPVHSHVGPGTMAAGRLPVGWLRLVEYGSGNGDHVSAYCGWDCVLKTAGRFEPPTVIGMDD